jgi:DNA polymerase III subunit gamma/tau
VSYLVLARKWRPQTFSDLVGQDHVSRTLANAIAQNRVAHAFLFTGVRGVGKTTSARIMAKALNCQKGPTATPCLACPPCTEIAAGSDTDVQEIDGASYNGVDEVRKLQETLPYRPARDRHKIFIVDEVHMLSQSAWNAFLKTLEEPPPHVKFIFATTEVHKVPITILSRCQRYDFKLIPAQLIAQRLRYVLGEEKIVADEAAVALIAREAAGSLRDAMSLLDQAIAWGGEKLVGDEVARVLGVAGRTVLHRIAQALVQGDAAACLEITHELSDQGFDIAHAARDILGYLRDLVVAKVCSDAGALLDCPAEEAREIVALAGATGADDLIRLQHGFGRSFDDIARSAQPRAALEMALVRLAQRPPLVPLDELVERLSDLERRLGGGPPSAPPGRPPMGSPPAPGRPPPQGRPASGTGPRASAAAVAVARAPTPEVHASPEAKPDLDAWREVLTQIRAVRAPLASVLEHASPIAFGPEKVVLGYEPGSFLAQQAVEDAAIDLLTRTVRDHFGAPTEVAFDLRAEAAGAVSVASIDQKKNRERLEAAKKAASEHPLVKAAVEILGAEIREIRLAE